MADSNGSSAEQALSPVLDWYSKVYSRRVDLVGDYAGEELFIIEGDSILLHCFTDKQIDFNPNFQLLHAVYAIESFLRSLVVRRCNFHIAFFDQHRELCVPQHVSADDRQKYLLARAAIIRHLGANLKSLHPDIEVHNFPSVHSTRFAEYLRTTDVYFILCHDGAVSGSSRDRKILDKDSATTQNEDQEQNERVKIMFRMLIFWFVERGYNAALVNGLRFRDTKVVTTVLENSRAKRHDVSQQQTSYVTDEPSNDEQDSVPYDQSRLSSIHSRATSQLTEREYLTFLTLLKLSSSEDIDMEQCSAFLRHLALLSELPLTARLPKDIDLDEDGTDFIVEFCSESRRILQSVHWQNDVAKLGLVCDVADLVDGKLFAACLEDESLGAGDRFRILVDAIKFPLGESSAPPSKPLSQAKFDKLNKSDHTYAVLPLSNTVFDKHLSPVELVVDRSGDEPDSTSAMVFREAFNWHNSKRPVDPKIREEQLARSKKQAFFANRRNQWFMAEMTAYAASLTNAVGKALEPEIITTGVKGSKAPTAPPAEVAQGNAKGKANAKNNKKPAMSKKQAMLADIAAKKSKKDEASAEKIIQGWKLSCKTLDQEPNLATKYQKARQYQNTLNNDLKRDTLEAEVRLYQLNILLEMWIGFCRNNQKEQNLHLAALVFDTISSFQKFRRPITKTIANSLTTSNKLLKLPQLVLPSPTEDRALSFNFVLKASPTVDITIPLPAQRFQLLHCGPYFERSIDSAPDHRVPFEPDAWQRKVLDEIDARNSLLVIAPTSAGKTFISFYAMKQVLEANNDDILVYVAPTKALVNQIAAEVQARFSKRYEYGGNSVWGIHTGDYRINNPTGCQILVTVPHILQMMLLAPSNAKSWSQRVKWIIFDEVHCIGQAEDGLVWEQLLLLAPCPIIALSATIGNPQEFNAWLTSTQEAVGNKMRMVQHPHRYSDLRKFVYTPPKAYKFEGLSDNRAFAQLGLDNAKDFTFLHPITSLVNRGRGVPSDFSLEARDCLTLWESMSKHQKPGYTLDKSLDPASALPNVVKKTDIIKWEASIKEVLKAWLADSNSPFDAVHEDLSRDANMLEDPIKDEGTKEVADTKTVVEDHEELNDVEVSHDIDGILPLLENLHSQDALPGIIFNYDRGIVEKIGQNLLKQLVETEASWKETSPKWKSDLQAWETWKKAMAKADKRGPPKVSKKKGGGGDDEVLSKADLMRDAASSDASPWASFDPENPQDGFHFADKRKASLEELAKYFKELIRREVPQYLLDALRRGIGIHHAGMNRKYRQVVEMLFRKGFLRVVIATGTLALGINMPCKTVVFSGDSVFLSALNYRQAAGRAGRRGFDMLGNVVFHGISLGKVHRLVSSRLPDLNGHFPITTTLVLRLFTLLNESKESPFAIRSVNALLSQPRLYLGGEESKMTVLHHLRFSIEYLRRQFLLDSRGAPLNFAGCVSHLYFAENSAFAFHALLKDGFFHKLCANVEKNSENVLKELMLTLAHLFGRVYCRQADQEHVDEVVKKSQSLVFLPPMPTDAAHILRSHNSSTLEIFSAYVQTFAEKHIDQSDDKLPLTQIKIGGEDVPTHARSLERRPPTNVRSAFVALSGHDDQFDSVHDLCNTARSGVFLEEAVVPYVPLYPEESELPLNAYLYDFFTHGDVAALASANKIRSGDVWYVLNDFSMVLATIVTSLSTFMNLTSASDLDFTDVRGEGEEEEERKEDELLPEDSGYETASTTSMPNKFGAAKQDLTVQTKKKKKVADSWDDDADEEDFQEEIAAKRAEKKKQSAMAEKPAWEEGADLMNVLKAFKMLREDFDTKFRAMWA
ncbi:DEAD/DEAH box helicase [Aaosphaeria arxii CBS 175.79]|uniref:DEAD/DEAH box helicase n=1 Tax=Aaosphaeria arxii CBS 175.79 TaxID=1450172 RepID=A0A6A5Y6Y7_9PLEO|nr:DEAD/DEAH box helicase [Aaosphaeria arxii CBS 175.79]KAF2021325.1 DEAD/DEAH box helicase [Aaosphaeria arxii CBS 175.79]